MWKFVLEVLSLGLDKSQQVCTGGLDTYPRCQDCGLLPCAVPSGLLPAYTCHHFLTWQLRGGVLWRLSLDRYTVTDTCQKVSFWGGGVGGGSFMSPFLSH